MEERLAFKRRKDLENKMTEVFRENISVLSTELQRILVDDLVTAFQNRMKVLIRAEETGNY
ncbi:MAG: hypothetical protein PVH12_03150 [Candidatus Bathyarchaeota archaeon]|jgi:hypothetical protein